MATAQNNASLTARQRLCVALAAVAKAAAEDGDRDELIAGSHHNVKLSLAAEVDGVPVLRGWDATLDVGHDSTRASSTGVKPGELLAYLLSRVNEVTRAATLRDLADTFAAHGRLPVSEDQIKDADAALAKLRQKVDQSVKGSVRVSVRRVDGDEAAPAAPVATPAPAAPVAPTTAPESLPVPLACRRGTTAPKAPTTKAASRKTTAKR